MVKKNMYPHVKAISYAATLVVRCDEHGDHSLTVSSSDDFCWVVAEWLRSYLGSQGYECQLDKRRVKLYGDPPASEEEVPF